MLRVVVLLRGDQFFTDTPSPEICTLSLHDALPIYQGMTLRDLVPIRGPRASSTKSRSSRRRCACRSDRKSTRLNSSHTVISYAVFCLKKKARCTDAKTLPHVGKLNYLAV